MAQNLNKNVYKKISTTRARFQVSVSVLYFIQTLKRLVLCTRPKTCNLQVHTLYATVDGLQYCFQTEAKQ